MEKNSTPRADLLPRAANLATLAVVAAAMWWSGAQRPAGQAVLAVSDTVPAALSATQSVAHAADATAQRQPAPLSTTATAGNATAAVATWPAQVATSFARDGLQAVGYQTRTR